MQAICDIFHTRFMNLYMTQLELSEIIQSLNLPSLGLLVPLVSIAETPTHTTYLHTTHTTTTHYKHTHEILLTYKHHQCCA